MDNIQYTYFILCMSVRPSYNSCSIYPFIFLASSYEYKRGHFRISIECLSSVYIQQYYSTPVPEHLRSMHSLETFKTFITCI